MPGHLCFGGALALGAMLAACASVTLAANDLAAALSSPNAQAIETFVITDGGAAACAYGVANPPADPGPITAATYTAFLTGCQSPPTSVAAANQFLTGLAVAYLEARLLGR